MNLQYRILRTQWRNSMKMWISRDMDGTLWLSEGEPYLEEKGEWYFRNGYKVLEE